MGTGRGLPSLQPRVINPQQSDLFLKKKLITRLLGFVIFTFLLNYTTYHTFHAKQKHLTHYGLIYLFLFKQALDKAQMMQILWYDFILKGQN